MCWAARNVLYSIYPIYSASQISIQMQQNSFPPDNGNWKLLSRPAYRSSHIQQILAEWSYSQFGILLQSSLGFAQLGSLQQIHSAPVPPRRLIMSLRTGLLEICCGMAILVPMRPKKIAAKIWSLILDISQWDFDGGCCRASFDISGGNSIISMVAKDDSMGIYIYLSSAEWDFSRTKAFHTDMDEVGWF